MNAHEVVSAELARHLCEISHEISRQVGVLLDRRGEVTGVIVGDAMKLELPDVGRGRAGEWRLRGLRLVHTHLKDEPLTRDDLTDLALLRLDLVCAINVRPDGLPGAAHVGYLAGASPSDVAKPWITEDFADLFAVTIDPLKTIEGIENSFSQSIRARSVSSVGRALLVGVALHGKAKAESSMGELKELARTAGVEVVDVMIQSRPQIDGRYLIGEGKLQEVALRAMQLVCDLIVFDHDLSAAQARNLAAATSFKILDRTQLILDIFAQRAESADGKLQVELAQLKYLLPRLTKIDLGLSRLAGGIGGRGPGETKLETDRRRVRDRISALEDRIDALSRTRALRRSQRSRHDVPIIAIVGYTNAGKSTLLNALTNADVLAEDKLFATLDTTSRRLRFPRQREVVLTDTVGFIRDLPPTLVNAFRATLEELSDADLLLHVVDAADPEHARQVEDVERILGGLDLLRIPRLVVLNQCDRLAGGIDGDAAQAIARGWDAACVSALTQDGFAGLLSRAESMLWQDGKVGPPQEQVFENPKPARTAAPA